MRLIELSPRSFAEQLLASGRRRAWIAPEPGASDGGAPIRTSAPELTELAGFLRASPDHREHEAVFLEVGRETGVLFGVFVHATVRGQAQGGVRHRPYSDVAAFLSDGLRLSLGMGRKCALAGLWWGGGKALIAKPPGPNGATDDGYRRAVYADFGRFVTSLGGCYVTAEDAGTSPLDMAEIYRHTRFATCVPPDVGGSGNPSAMTAAGVVCAMEAALDFLEIGDLAGKRVAMRGAGNVGSFMIDDLLERGVEEISVTELDAEWREVLLERFAGKPVEVRLVEPDDDGILSESCDILAPNALGGSLNQKTIPGIAARIVCGCANNQLADDERDARMLAQRGITYVPDFVANRMGIVSCSNEHAGSLPSDPAILRHLKREWDGSIYRVTRDILERARESGETPVEAANRIADRRAHEPHPIWGHRANDIIRSLIDSSWVNH